MNWGPEVGFCDNGDELWGFIIITFITEANKHEEMNGNSAL
jgi:hypothetical protein